MTRSTAIFSVMFFVPHFLLASPSIENPYEFSEGGVQVVCAVDGGAGFGAARPSKAIEWLNHELRHIKSKLPKAQVSAPSISIADAGNHSMAFACVTVDPE